MGGGSGDWFSFTSTALANFAAQYNFQAIAICLQVMSASVCTIDDADCKTGEQAAWIAGSAEATIFIGAVVGQLSMGFLGDILTRNQALTVTLATSAFGAFLSAVAPAGDPNSIYGVIVLFRFILGIGLGGIYPLSATKSSEDSASQKGKTNSSGSAMAFFWQIPGATAPWVLSYLFTYTSLSTGYRWRLVLGLGAIPPALSILCLWLEAYHKPHIHEQASAKTTVQPLPHPAPTTALIFEKLKDPKIRGKLIGCGGSWLLYDVVFYGLTLLGGVVIGDITDGDDDVSSPANIRKLCSKQSIALSLGAISVAISIILLPYLSLKYLQITGFLVQAFFLALFVVLFTYLRANDSNGLFALYCLVLMSLQLGVPVTTYALPASVFQKDIRCTFNGMASAMGKIGAIIGAYTFYYIAQASIHAVLVICVIVCLIGALMTHFYIEDGTLSNDDSAGGACNSKSSLFRTVRIDMEDSIMLSPLADNSLHSHCDHENNSNIDTSL